MESEITFRKAELCDIPALTEIEQACFSDPWNEKAILGHISSPVGRAVLIYRDGVPAGEILWQCISPEWELFRIAVLPQFRGMKIGSAAGKYLLSCIADESCRCGYLEVRVSNTPAISLYRKLGFTDAAVRRHYYRHPDEDALIMTKKD